ncbi:MAG: hypothetical protein JSV56_03740 [Methanomassiliicoccales archaeon]|nr:MAG: hypothetical protein JSV56_03740 [Methanomassiliicoccales archaeon]
MKKKTRRISGMFLCLVMVAMVFAVTVPMNMSADSQVPFKGNLDGSTVPSGNPYVERIEVSGQASHLGKYTAVVEAYMPGGQVIGVDPETGLYILLLPTTATFTAANGDELYADLVLVGGFDFTPTVMNFPSFTLTGTITGGTGRLAGASGTFTGSGGQISVPGPDNDLISGTFSGMISTVGSNK